MDLVLVDYKGNIFFQEEYDSYDMQQYHRIAYAVDEYMSVLSDEDLLKYYDINRVNVFKELRMRALLCHYELNNINEEMLRKVEEGTLVPDTLHELVHEWYFEIRTKFIPKETDKDEDTILNNVKDVLNEIVKEESVVTGSNVHKLVLKALKMIEDN